MNTAIIYHGVTKPPVPPAPAEGESREVAGVSKPRLLLVEDNYIIGMTVEDSLSAAGYDVVWVLSGEDAVEEGAAIMPDLVLMDVRLAGEMSGVDAAIELRKLGIPCLFTTAHSGAAIRDAAKPADPLGWLTKPFTMSDLLSSVTVALTKLERQ